MADVNNQPPSTYQYTWTKSNFVPPLQPLLLWQSLSLFWLCGLMAARFTWPCILGAIIILFIDTRLRQKSCFLMAIALFLLGFFLVQWQLEPRPPYPTWAIQNQTPIFTRMEGTVQKVESLTDKRLRITLSHVRSLEHKDTPPLDGLMLWVWEAKKSNKKFSEIKHPITPLVGQKVQISARIRTTEGFRNWGLSNFGFYWQSRGIFWRIWSRGDFGNPQIIGIPKPLAVARQKAMANLEQALFAQQHLNIHEDSLQNQAKAFILALLFGEKYYLNHQSIQKMQAASLVHSLALSGQHLALVVLAAFTFIMLFKSIFPQMFLILPHKKWLGLLSLPLAALYLWIGNAPPSLIRASIMLALGLLFYWRMRMVTLGDILLMTVLLISSYNPLAIFNLGLQLSVLCVASIVLALPLLRRIPMLEKQDTTLKFYAYKFGRNICQIFIISFVIQVALLPVFLYYFAPSGPWFISNIFWLPILGFWVLPLAALGLVLACIWPKAVFTQQILDLATWPCEILLNILQYMQNEGLFNFPAILRPHWTSLLAWVMLCVALALLAGRFKLKIHENSTIKKLTILGICLLFIGPVLRYAGYWKQDVQLDLLDVGQGQAVCITIKGGQRILIDGGGSLSPRFDTGQDLVIPSLTSNFPPRLWAVVSTHPDMDHLRGLMAVLDKMQIETFYHNGQAWGRRYASKLQAMHDKFMSLRLVAGMNISLANPNSGIKLEVLNPPKSHEFSSNNASIVLRLVHEDKFANQGIALLCGDAEVAALRQILHSNKNIAANILVLPHHGSRDALLPEFYAASKPKLALVSSAKLNNFAFPHPSVTKALQQSNIPIYNTADRGAIRIIWRNNIPIYKVAGKHAPPSIFIETYEE